MAYILAVNPAILASSGGTCPEDHADLYNTPNAIYDPNQNAPWTECINTIREDLVVATAVCAFLATLIMGMTANLPLALAPGMGLNAYFTFEVVGFNGGGKISYGDALGAIFLEGLLFMLLTFVGFRTALAKALPKSIKYATAAGIGLFLAHIGLQQAEGIGLVTTDLATGVELGGCGHRGYSDNMICGSMLWSVVNFDGSRVESIDGMTGIAWGQGDGFCHCNGGKMTGATTWLGIAGFIIICIMIIKRMKGAIIAGVLFVTIISWFKGHSASFFDCDERYIPDCDARYDAFKKVAEVRSLQKTGGALSFNLSKWDTWAALLTFFYVDVLDTTGTLYSMASYMEIIDEEGNFPGMYSAYLTDGLATSIGALMGTSPTTTYIESADGIREGARTGFASVVTAFYFFLAIFFAPIFSAIPPWAMGPALIIVGALMMKQVTQIDWDKPIECIPAFVCLVIMPLTYSIAYGIVAGIFMSIVLNAADYLLPGGGQEKTGYAPDGVNEVGTLEMQNKKEEAEETATE